jgi:transcription initiation factor TFIID subunit TAF12
MFLEVRSRETKLQGLNSEREEKLLMVDMDEWRSIDYKERLEKELKTLEKSKISKSNKKLILRYKNWRIADGVSFAGVNRELVSLRTL